MEDYGNGVHSERRLPFYLILDRRGMETNPLDRVCRRASETSRESARGESVLAAWFDPSEYVRPYQHTMEKIRASLSASIGPSECIVGRPRQKASLPDPQ